MYRRAACFFVAGDMNHAEFWWGDARERDHLEDQGVNGIILKLIFKKWDRKAWTELIWHRIGTGGGLLYMR
jgi:hypothetical protein